MHSSKCVTMRSKYIYSDIKKQQKVVKETLGEAFNKEKVNISHYEIII